MVKKRVDLAAITAISEQAAHIKNVDDGLSDKTKIKTKKKMSKAKIEAPNASSFPAVNIATTITKIMVIATKSR